MDFCLFGGVLLTGQMFNASLGCSLKVKWGDQDGDKQQGTTA